MTVECIYGDFRIDIPYWEVGLEKQANRMLKSPVCGKEALEKYVLNKR